ncbi:hypothetical protein FBU30_009833 [Linnemannia zychae]|nr:hypothetical protein FBU30_009833 [Linnemannia zychae]
MSVKFSKAGLLATIFGFSRYVTVKMARQEIPKTYMPITQEDLPKVVYEFVQSELDRVARLAKKATPLLEESRQPGWGRPGSSLQDTHFKTFMASTPHFIERAAVAYSPDLARPPNMSISAYIHWLIDQKLITRDIGLEYIAGYEQARFGSTQNDPSPVIMSPFQPQQVQPQPPHSRHHHHHHHRQHTSSGRHARQSSGLNPRQNQSQHPGHDPSTTSTIGGASQHLQTIGSSVGSGNGVGANTGGAGTREGQEILEEEEYIRFMKVLSWILQELGWDQAAEEAYEEEFRAQEQREAEQKQLYQAQYQYQQDEVYKQQQQQQQQQEEHESAVMEMSTDYYPSDEGGSTMMLQPRRKYSQLSGDSYFMVGNSKNLEVDPQFLSQQQYSQRPSQQHPQTSSQQPNQGGSQNRRMTSRSISAMGGSVDGTANMRTGAENAGSSNNGSGTTSAPSSADDDDDDDGDDNCNCISPDELLKSEIDIHLNIQNGKNQSTKKKLNNQLVAIGYPLLM